MKLVMSGVCEQYACILCMFTWPVQQAGPGQHIETKAPSIQIKSESIKIESYSWLIPTNLPDTYDCYLQQSFVRSVNMVGSALS